MLGQNTTFHYSMVKFDLSWDHSWRTSTFENNWDAAWVFIKFRKRSSLAWSHGTLGVTGHIAPAGSIISPTVDRKGAFIYRSANGIGNNLWTGVQLLWGYGTDGLQDYDSVEVCVFAIEMVYVPQGNYFLGDGGTTVINGQFESGNSGSPYQITSEGQITSLGWTSSLRTHLTVGQSRPDDFGTFPTLPAAFPKGFAAYYMMKYEISQEQYAEFLNKLTLTQQSSRTNILSTSPAGTGVFGNLNRNGIDMQIPGIPLTSVAQYACNLDGDALYNEVNDGQNVPCNFLNVDDLFAYLDWSGLRPLTEFEFEKACRGNISPVADEYAWGGNFLTGATAIGNVGLNNEAATNAGANCAYNNAAGVQGPLRTGAFALATNRQNSGGAYYGAMELSGNLAEPYISIGNPDGRSFTGNHGDGNLDANGGSNVANWPPVISANIGIIYRGGDWIQGNALMRISDRTNPAAYLVGLRRNDTGGRGGRTAP